MGMRFLAGASFLKSFSGTRSSIFSYKRNPLSIQVTCYTNGSERWTGMQGVNLSHSGNPSLEEVIAKRGEVRMRIKSEGDKSYASVEELLYWLDWICESELGRFILCNQGLNGKFTRYFTYHSVSRMAPGLNSYGTPLDPFESFFLEKPMLIVASSERARIFDRTIQQHIRNDVVFGSVPCGVMTDLLTLDFSNAKGFKLVGLDIDRVSLNSAKQISEAFLLEKHCEFRHVNVFEMNFESEFDLLSSSGITLYMKSEEDIVLFYSKLYKALKPGGTLVTSFCTTEDEWDKSNQDPETVRLEKAILVDILKVGWRNQVSTHRLREQLTSAGFNAENIKVISDTNNVMPTVEVCK